MMVMYVSLLLLAQEKTLAYVAPMVEALKDFQATKLRGIIVVPTRELVQQVRQLYEICAAGTSLKMATAAGSKSIKEEQKTLVTEDEIYDPVQYEKQRAAPVDWLTFSIEELMKDTMNKGRLEPGGFVRRFQIKHRHSDHNARPPCRSFALYKRLHPR